MNTDRRKVPPTPTGLQSVVFRLTREKRDAVHNIARASRVRNGELLRMAIEDVLRKHEREGT